MSLKCLLSWWGFLLAGPPPPGVGWGDSQMKGGRMLIISQLLLRGVDFGLWSHLGCSGQNAFICLGLQAKKYENIYLICFKYGLF